MDIPYCFVKGKSKLGQLVQKIKNLRFVFEENTSNTEMVERLFEGEFTGLTATHGPLP